MIVVDSSVWIDEMRGAEGPAVLTLRHFISREEVLVGDIVLLELLQGARDDRHARFIEGYLQSFEIVEMLDIEIARQAARNFRMLRSYGRTIRKTVDMIIATYCIVHGHPLLQQDRDFTPMAEHLGLRLA
jgi:predicted nucleic acid-binding protein